ncbi:MAG: NAD(+)/NADH kinase [Myxococcota bacterium]
MIRFTNNSARAATLGAAVDALGLAAGFAEDVCLVLGGDGTMLRAIQRHGPAYRYLGINCGHLGFLMNELPGEDEDVARRVVDVIGGGRFISPSFPRLGMRAEGAHGLAEARALNDVYVERQVGQTCHLRVTVDGVEVVGSMVCDGLVVASALGSTAYSFSAGGPAAHPCLRALHVTAICPHTPRLAPIVLPFTSQVRIEVLDPRVRRARAVADGVPVEDVSVVEIGGGDDEVRLCFFEGHDFTTTMIRKILHP